MAQFATLQPAIVAVFAMLVVATILRARHKDDSEDD